MTAVLASCGSAQLPEAGQAEPHYDAVISDVQDALGGLGYELVHAPATRSWEEREGICTYTPGNYEADGLSAALADEEERSEEHTSELQSRGQLVCRLLREKKKEVN